MSIRIVTHAYAVDYDLYAVFLRSQLSSLDKYRSKYPVKITICCLEEGRDERIETVLFDFQHLRSIGMLDTHRMDSQSLFRRAVGRNEVALESQEDLVWFCDADYFMGKGCIDHICWFWESLPEPKPVFIWPRRTWIHKTHEIGDEVWKSYRKDRGLIFPDIFLENFKSMRYDYAIGGLQIMNGFYARRAGYLNNTKWAKPIDWHGPVTTAEDVKFRKMCKSLGDGSDKPCSPPNLFRLRHSETGLSKRGQPAGKRVEFEKRERKK